jgi:hypothetical protein
MGGVGAGQALAQDAGDFEVANQKPVGADGELGHLGDGAADGADLLAGHTLHAHGDVRGAVDAGADGRGAVGPEERSQGGVKFADGLDGELDVLVFLAAVDGAKTGGGHEQALGDELGLDALGVERGRQGRAVEEVSGASDECGAVDGGGVCGHMDSFFVLGSWFLVRCSWMKTKNQELRTKNIKWRR